MAMMTLGIFSRRNEADAAIIKLEESGYNTNEISIVMRDTVVGQHSESKGSQIIGGAASGATTGGLIGGLAGLLIGVGAITIPGIGALLAIGPIAVALGLSGALATTVSGLITGAVAGGLVGGLVGLGVPEETAREYEDQIKAGGVLVAVTSESARSEEARGILSTHGADQIRSLYIGETREN